MTTPYDGGGSLFALGLRVTRLSETGAPLLGANNAYVTDALVTINAGLEFSEPDAVELRNGQGVVCVSFQPPPTLLRGTIDELRVCTPDPNVLQFVSGGEIVTAGGTSEVQSIVITGSPTGGTFTLTFNAQTTSAIAFNASAATVQAALEGLSNISPGDVVCTNGPLPGTAVTVTFGGTYANTNVAQITGTSSLTGGTTPAVSPTTTTPGVAGTSVIGYRPPPVNVDPTPNGVAIEAWSRAVVNNAFAASLPYFHWVFPRAKLRPSEALTLSGEDPTTPQFSGTCEENALFGDGPVSDIAFPTNRVWQYVRVASVPNLSPGFVTVT